MSKSLCLRRAFPRSTIFRSSWSLGTSRREQRVLCRRYSTDNQSADQDEDQQSKRSEKNLSTTVKAPYPKFDRRETKYNVNPNGSLCVVTRTRGQSTHKEVDPLFLRDSCYCDLCVDQSSGQKKFRTTDIPTNIHVKHVDFSTKRRVTVHWGDDIAGFDSHSSTFSPDRLERMATPKPPRARSQASAWNGKDMSRRFGLIDYKTFIGDQRVFKESVQKLITDGIMFFENVPESEKSVVEIGERFGNLRDTFYGRTWDVKDQENAKNVAYTSGRLDLHMDLLYMQEPPGYQILHCLKSSEVGGASLFSDGLLAAKTIASTSPDVFHELSSFPVSYAYTKGGHSYYDVKPVFQLDPYLSRDSTPSVNDSKVLLSALKNINWSPPFQAPLPNWTVSYDRGQKLRQWHSAARVFELLISHQDNVFKHHLQPGQCVIFDNRRILHGRESFSNSGVEKGKERWLKGAYLDRDVMWSKSKTVLVNTGDKTKGSVSSKDDSGDTVSKSRPDARRTTTESSTDTSSTKSDPDS